MQPAGQNTSAHTLPA